MQGAGCRLQGCGCIPSTPAPLHPRCWWVMQMSGSQLYLADISSSHNRPKPKPKSNLHPNPNPNPNPKPNLNPNPNPNRNYDRVPYCASSCHPAAKVPIVRASSPTPANQAQQTGPGQSNPNPTDLTAPSHPRARTMAPLMASFSAGAVAGPALGGFLGARTLTL